MTPAQVLHAYVGAFVDELVRAGLTDVCLAPGSRSAPLAYLVAARPDLKLWTHLDERSAGYFALGLAKAARRPVALICTSGTAAANFLPAVVEARLARVPLLVLTADRPPELRDTGAPQTIDQQRLYGGFAKWFVELLLPEATADALRYVRTVAGRALALAQEAPAGAVHLNFPFREPLIPAPPDTPAEDVARAAGRPYAVVSPGRRAPEPAAVAQLAAELAGIERGLIVAGPQTDPDFPAALAALAEALQYPILADPLSQVRCGPHPRLHVLDAYDACLRDPATVATLPPEVILRLGAMPTSKPALQYLQKYPEARQILIDPGGEWQDPPRLAAQVLQADPVLACAALTAALPRGVRAGGSPWLARWRALDACARAAIAQQVAAFAEPFEGRVFAELAGCLPEGATLFASSSMPVRDLDTFFPGSGKAVRFLANRGANGIDGVVSSALGAAAAGPGPLVLVIGDVALYHDLNGLLAARRHGLSATVILINNDGGGIFSFLPQAAHPDNFELLFGTPHGLDFRPAAELYGAAFHRPADWAAFRAAVQAGLAGSGLTLIEVRTQRDANVTQHRAVWKAVAAALRG
ncbi:MAG: 2-succinyl-5-enolpyruvyl-6-hydroxy-3-cyclohexene-1-carboxylic-acid synthase [Anaerolineales bacterium]|nr:2-succinyl-5-enolpyruvyl-6-hydroxy-3-cyclohexene-1-carboxylic-acid synthase [Anaerolineales bacterium]